MEAFTGLGPLPQGWESKIEPKTGRIYFIDHKKKRTTWDDPRLESIPTPPYHIAIQQPTSYFEDGLHWSSPVPSVRAYTLNRRGSSPRLGASPKIAPSPTPTPRNKRNEQLILEAVHKPPTPCTFRKEQEEAAPMPVRRESIGEVISTRDIGTGTNGDRPCSARSFSSSTCPGTPAPTSFLSNCDPELAFRTVLVLFPSAPEPHIRHLFHKYHNRATLVVSALQVDKYAMVDDVEAAMEGLSPKRDADSCTVTSIPPDSKSLPVSSPYKVNSFTTGSPARTGTPMSPFRQGQSACSGTRSGSPYYPSSPHLTLIRDGMSPRLNGSSSPKMKLKYLKGIFPAADETFLLDLLSSSDNNVMKATDKLLKKGFARTPPPKPARHKWLEVKALIEKRQRVLDEQKLNSDLNLNNQKSTSTNSGILGVGNTEKESPFPTPIMRSVRPHLSEQKKVEMQEELTKEFPKLPQRFISWALEAANYEKRKASTLLKQEAPQTPQEFKPFVSPIDTAEQQLAKESSTRSIRFADEENGKKNTPAVADIVDSAVFMKLSEDEIVLASDYHDSGIHKKKSYFASLLGSKDESVKSTLARGSMGAKGANPSLRQGFRLATGSRAGLSKGPNSDLLLSNKCGAKGANPMLAKGARWMNKVRGKSDKPANVPHLLVSS